MASTILQSTRKTQTRHRPGALSLDASNLARSAAQGGTASDKHRSLHMSSTPGKEFVKLRASVNGAPLTGIPPELHRMRYATRDADMGQTVVSPVLSPRFVTVPSTQSLKHAGSLLQSASAGGASVSLTLDRSIHYCASPRATSAWSYHDYVSATMETHGSPSMAENPFSDPTGIASVPRVLLAFTLDIQPKLKAQDLGIRENYEFLSVQFDFWTASSGESSRRSLHSCDMPIVRGFATGDLPSSGFLQSFGSTLYESLHASTAHPHPVVLGSNSTEDDTYRAFERNLAKRQSPTRLGADKVAARSTDDGTSSMPATPLSAGFRNGGDYPTTPTSPAFEVSAYGTSSIRVMVKRDTTQEAAWCARKIPFLILLEYPPTLPAIEAKLKLDTSTIKQNLPGVSRRNSLSLSAREKRMSTQARQSKNPPVSTSAMLARKLSVASGPSKEENEELVKIYPRTDAISVVSCGAGTVRDTLYPTSLKSTQQALTQTAQCSPARAQPQHSQSSPCVTQLQPQPSPVRPRIRHSHSQSAQLPPGMFRRTSSYCGADSRDPNVTTVESERSVRTAGQSAPSTRSSPSPPESNLPARRRRESIAISSGVRDTRVRSMTASTSYTAGSSDSARTASTRASGDSQTTAPSSAAPDEDLDDLFDMVLTTWTEQKMREYSPPESIVYVNSPTMEKQFIPFANGRF